MSEVGKDQQFEAAGAAHASERIIHRLKDPAPEGSQPQLGQELAPQQARYRHLDG
jgi:hypothetical protein